MAVSRQHLTVLKLGGSFAFSPHLPRILQAIGSVGVPLVVVPGGGPFADAVREAQPRMGFDDRAAHRMALMAMAQFTEALVALAPSLDVAADPSAIRRTLDRHRVAVWSPWPMADGLDTLPESWQLTSDSLAAWLAGRLGASRLLMLKHGDRPVDGPSFESAVAAGIVDHLFPGYARASGAAVSWLWPSEFDALVEVLGAQPSARCEQLSA